MQWLIYSLNLSIFVTPSTSSIPLLGFISYLVSDQRLRAGRKISSVRSRACKNKEWGWCGRGAGGGGGDGGMRRTGGCLRGAAGVTRGLPTLHERSMLREVRSIDVWGDVTKRLIFFLIDSSL